MTGRVEQTRPVALRSFRLGRAGGGTMRPHADKHHPIHHHHPTGRSRMSRTTRTVVGALAATLLLLLAACGGTGNDSRTGTSVRQNQAKQIEAQDAKRQPYTPHNDVEFNNFNEAQKLYDSPTTIIWCTAFPSNPNAPFITTPIAGKLTSSSVSYRPQQELQKLKNSDGVYSYEIVDSRSSDGMYHGSPQPYRYGFTPGGVYVDFTNLSTFCTTSLTKFQRESTTLAVSVDAAAAATTSRAEDALKTGDKKEAQRILDALDGSK